MGLKRKIRFGPRPRDPEPEDFTRAPEQCNCDAHTKNMPLPGKTKHWTCAIHGPCAFKKPKPKPKTKKTKCNCERVIKQIPPGTVGNWTCPKHGARSHFKKPQCVCKIAKTGAAPGETVHWSCPEHGPLLSETMPGEPGWVLISSQYDGFCHVCKEDFAVGTMIYWKKGHGTCHAQCHETNIKGEKNMGVWDGIEDAETFERGNYVKGGFIGVVEIKKTIEKPTRAIGPAFIVEMEVVETNMEEHPVGQKVTWFQKLSDKNIAFAAVTEWVAAVAGVDPTNKEAVKTQVSPVIKEAMDHAVRNPSDNDFIGQKVRLQTDQIKTKNDRDFTRYTWMPFEATA